MLTPAILVSVWLPHQTEEEHVASIAEMKRLMHTMGLEAVHTLTQRLQSLQAAAVLGGGRLMELASLTGGTGVVPSGATRKPTKAQLREEQEPKAPSASTADPIAQTIVVDNDISPSQMRNLERATGANVLDRSGVIIEIFHRHANTREARLQVELARLKYEAPRLREKEHGGSERGGGVGGKGESTLELDRRRIRDRMAALRAELDAIAQNDAHRRSQRQEQNRVALIGYTNAGKSSLMRALTESQVLVADKLFATLGTTVRSLQPERTPRILISDTVGFIRNLPHDLVASFRSTLDEARSASLLLFVVDAGDPDFRSQLEVTHTVLKEIGVENADSRLVLNKIDRVDEENRQWLRREFPDAWQTAAVDRELVSEVRERIIAFFEGSWEETSLLFPYSAYDLLSTARTEGELLDEAHEEQGTRVKLRATTAVIERLKSELAKREA